MSDIVERLRARQVTNWVHATGQTPRASGKRTDPLCAAAADEIERLRAEVAGLREDAERYRWLRDECPWTMVSGNGKSNLSIRVRAEFDLGDLVDMVDEFDAAIDAARKGEA